MRIGFGGILGSVIVGISAVLASCATENAYQKAFSDQSALAGNSKTFAAPVNQTLKAVKRTLINQGFTIEQADSSTGLIKAVRNYQDPTDNAVSYNINATADVTAAESDEASSDVTLAASQQTVLHREWHDWWHLLWIIPLFPTGTEYQTVVTKEGNVTDIAFYNDFFAAVDKSLHKLDANASSVPTSATPNAVPIATPPAATADKASPPQTAIPPQQ